MEVRWDVLKARC